MQPLQLFLDHLRENQKSENTIEGYGLDLKQYFNWFADSFGQEGQILYRQNVLEYVSFLKTVKRVNAKTINRKISSLRSYNEFLIESKVQEDMAVKKTDLVKIQTQYASPTKVTEKEARQFMQRVLESKDKRNYAIIILLAYTGLRISEALAIQLDDYNLQTGECIIRNGKGEKQRTVYLNSKVIHALRDYLKVRNKYAHAEISPYLFLSKKSKKLDRTTVNRIFKKINPEITPHELRHFFCTNAIEKGLSIHEVANQAGHSNIHTTLLYTNPDKAKLKNKMEFL